MRQYRGFTLLEIMLVVAILSVVMAVAAPSLSSYLDRRKLISAAEALYGEFQYARSEAIARSQDVYVSFSSNATDTWSVGVSTAAGCDPTETEATAVGACVMVIDDGDGNVHGNDPDGDGTAINDPDDLVLRVMSSTDYPGIVMGNDSDPMGAVNFGGGGGEATFDGIRGMAAGNAGTVALKLGDELELHVILGQIGRVRICSPTGVGYSECP